MTYYWLTTITFPPAVDLGSMLGGMLEQSARDPKMVPSVVRCDDAQDTIVIKTYARGGNPLEDTGRPYVSCGGIMVPLISSHESVLFIPVERARSVTVNRIFEEE